MSDKRESYTADLERIRRRAAWRMDLLNRPTYPELCVECEISLADPPSKLCPGCQAYAEHQR